MCVQQQQPQQLPQRLPYWVKVHLFDLRGVLPPSPPLVNGRGGLGVLPPLFFLPLFLFPFLPSLSPSLPAP